MGELAWADVELVGQEEGFFPQKGTPASWRRVLTGGVGVGGGGLSLLQSLVLRLPAERWGKGAIRGWSHMTAPSGLRCLLKRTLGAIRALSPKADRGPTSD